MLGSNVESEFKHLKNKITRTEIFVGSIQKYFNDNLS